MLQFTFTWSLYYGHCCNNNRLHKVKFLNFIIFNLFLIFHWSFSLNKSVCVGGGLHATRHQKHQFFLKVLFFIGIQLFPFISNSMQLLKEKLLWFSKYVCTSSVVSIKGMWADIKACSWIIYPWQLDCTFHLKCEAEFLCRKKWDSKPFSSSWLRWPSCFCFSKIWWNICNVKITFFFLFDCKLKHLLLQNTWM